MIMMRELKIYDKLFLSNILCMKFFFMNGMFPKRIINYSMISYRGIPWTNKATIKFGTESLIYKAAQQVCLKMKQNDDIVKCMFRIQLKV